MDQYFNMLTLYDLQLGMRNDDFRNVKKIRDHLSSLPSTSQEFAWDEYCDWRIIDYKKVSASFKLRGIDRHSVVYSYHFLPVPDDLISLRI